MTINLWQLLSDVYLFWMLQAGIGILGYLAWILFFRKAGK
jgi:hypothetical protein